jgi:hypothetical protein
VLKSMVDYGQEEDWDEHEIGIEFYLIIYYIDFEILKPFYN